MEKNIKKWLFLDDIRTPIDKSWIIVRTYYEFIKEIEDKGINNFDLISFDHDLGDSNDPEKTGFDCLKYVVEICLGYDLMLPQINVHSDNTVGGENIYRYADNFYKFSGCGKKSTTNKIIIQ